MLQGVDWSWFYQCTDDMFQCADPWIPLWESLAITTVIAMVVHGIVRNAKYDRFSWSYIFTVLVMIPFIFMVMVPMLHCRVSPQCFFMVPNPAHRLCGGMNVISMAFPDPRLSVPPPWLQWSSPECWAILRKIR